jgi:hypothetical protein
MKNPNVTSQHLAQGVVTAQERLDAAKKELARAEMAFVCATNDLVNSMATEDGQPKQGASEDTISFVCGDRIVSVDQRYFCEWHASPRNHVSVSMNDNQVAEGSN